MTDASADLTAAELAEYCRVQARLLSGQLEALGEEVEALLAELESTAAELDERLAEHHQQLDGAARAPSPLPEDAVEDAIRETEAMQDDLAARQATVEDKQARMADLEALLTGYADLASDLEDGDADGEAALRRVFRFEARRDAPGFFPERLTVLEAATESDEPAADDDDP
ncbi:MAG: hypothetical protein ABEJ31_13340 [Haloarculaceae archaeon]